VGSVAVAAKHRGIDGTPIANFETLAVANREVVFLDAHDFLHAVAQDPIEPDAQVADAGRCWVDRVVRKDLEQPLADDGLPIRSSRRKIAVVVGNRRSWCVGQALGDGIRAESGGQGP
jgi:hypothetical protein